MAGNLHLTISLIRVADSSILRATCHPPFEALGAFLSSDVQEQSTVCSDWESGADEVISGRINDYSGIGNRFLVRVFRDWVLIQGIFEEDLRCVLSTRCFRDCVSAWTHALAEYQSGSRNDEFRMSFEFLNCTVGNEISDVAIRHAVEEWL
jgi:hypothetical protein